MVRILKWFIPPKGLIPFLSSFGVKSIYEFMPILGFNPLRGFELFMGTINYTKTIIYSILVKDDLEIFY